MRTRHQFSTRHAAALCGLVLASAAAPGVAAAQQPVSPTIVTGRSDEAHALHEQAEALQSSTVRRKDLKRAAKMHVHAAEIRGRSAPESFHCLWSAANLYYGVGSTRDAAWTMEDAASQAAERGDVANAVGAYLDASVLAAELHEPDRAYALGKRAEQLIDSPAISAAQRESLKARIAVVTEVTNRVVLARRLR